MLLAQHLDRFASHQSSEGFQKQETSQTSGTVRLYLKSQQHMIPNGKIGHSAFSHCYVKYAPAVLAKGQTRGLTGGSDEA